MVSHSGGIVFESTAGIKIYFHFGQKKDLTWVKLLDILKTRRLKMDKKELIAAIAQAPDDAKLVIGNGLDETDKVLDAGYSEKTGYIWIVTEDL